MLHMCSLYNAFMRPWTQANPYNQLISTVAKNGLSKRAHRSSEGHTHDVNNWSCHQGGFANRISVRFSERSSSDFSRYGIYGIYLHHSLKYHKYRTGRNLTQTFPKIIPKFVLQNLPTEGRFSWSGLLKRQMFQHTAASSVVYWSGLEFQISPKSMENATAAALRENSDGGTISSNSTDSWSPMQQSKYLKIKKKKKKKKERNRLHWKSPENTSRRLDLNQIEENSC